MSHREGRRPPAVLRPALTFCAVALSALSACDGTPPPEMTVTSDAGLQNLFDVPVNGLSADWVSRFNQGDNLFEIVLRDADGLGPLSPPHFGGPRHDDEDGLRGPGFAQKMSVVEADGLTPAADQSELAFG